MDFEMRAMKVSNTRNYNKEEVGNLVINGLDLQIVGWYFIESLLNQYKFKTNAWIVDVFVNVWGIFFC
jgi:hypothetical protein